MDSVLSLLLCSETRRHEGQLSQKGWTFRGSGQMWNNSSKENRLVKNCVCVSVMGCVTDTLHTTAIDKIVATLG